MMNRRELLRATGAAAMTIGASTFPLGWTAAADTPKRRILMFTRSEGYQHDVVKRQNGKLSLAERIATDLGEKHNFEVKCEKDGRVFVNEDLTKFDAFLFETQGDLGKEKSQDGQPPVPHDGKKALLDAIAGGVGFVGCHCAADTYHTKGYPDNRWEGQSRDQIDPYIAMIGAEFISHGEQQKGMMRAVDRTFAGIKGLKDFEITEEWYTLKNFAPDLHVILVQRTGGMRNIEYERPDFPATWARRHHKGRVFYTSMGHRDDVWNNALFQQILLGALSWAVGNVKADIAPNLKEATPKANDLPKPKK